MRRGRNIDTFVSLRGEPDHRTKNATGQHDVKVIMLAGRVRHGGDQQSQEHPHRQPKQNSQPQRIHLPGQVADADAGDETLKG